MKLALSLFFILIAFFAFSKNINASADLIINESMAQGDGGEEWVELYFPNGYFDITGYYFLDNADQKKTIENPQNCGNYAVLDIPSGRWLNNNEEETISLFDPEGNQIDSRTGKDPGKGKTLGRTPDESATWNETESPTKCASNSSAKAEESEATNISSAPTPSPTSTNTNPAPKSSPKPSPKASPKSSPSQSASTKKEILGERTSSSEATPSINSFMTPAPSTAPSPVESKIANFALGGGAILVVLSLAGYLWYKWEIKKTSKEADKNE